ncbi:MAG: type III-B CRISPR-associated protein Cas10/Cmr2, partial [Myxococcota bacterium]|nr:type III-B CRISPR-associated protein Cas10/Cmr2 [Myxococcota bacterium]
ELQEREAQAFWDLRELLERGGSAADVRQAFLYLWRRLPDQLVQEGAQRGLLWDRVPADSRCPDVSIWDHLRVTSALAFLDTPTTTHEVPDDRLPHLLLFSVGPVGTFLRESRKSQDLWMSSFLLSEIAFAAMGPILEHYGPDAILYPDLRENPRADRWLVETVGSQEVLPPSYRDPSSYASLIPNRFTALLPRGNVGDLPGIAALAQQCQAAAETKWQELTETVWRWLEDKCRAQQLDLRGVRSQWEAQLAFGAVLRTRFTVVPWRREEGLGFMAVGGALPCQDWKRLPSQPEQERQAEMLRAQRLFPWVPRDAWARYECARSVFLEANRVYFLLERGFDYALVHHQLRARHALRAREGDNPSPPVQSGEMCTLCGRRAALGPQSQSTSLDEQRDAMRSFWRQLDEERLGQERLCAVCITKRYLVEATEPAKGINLLWGGEQNLEARVPFPPTSAMAAQKYLRWVATDDRLRAARQAVLEALQRLGWKRTQFPRSLLPLEDAARRGDRKLLEYECQVLFPDALRAELRRRLYATMKTPDWEQVDRHLEAARQGRRGPDADAAAMAEQLVRLERAVQALVEQVRELADKDQREDRPAVPGYRFALLKIDGDQMGKLLLGTSIRASWRDVLHPEVVRRLENGSQSKQDSWRGFLGQHRLMGPSLHAFVSRALAEFAHCIAPWVVEREYGGRLIYAGGDDLLAMAPEEDALPMAARLQALFSAPWVVDTQPTERPWDWRQPGAPAVFDPKRASGRFRILKEDEEVVAPAPPQVVLPLLGPHHSLSAGIVYAHYKTRMGAVLSKASELLDQHAKERAGRAAVALTCFTRGGIKSVFALPWQVGQGRQGGRPAHQVIEQVVQAFREGQLPGKLPYKLRDRAPLMGELLDSALGDEQQQDTQEFLRRMVRDALDGESPSTQLLDAVVMLWEQGFRLNRGRPERSADGLLLCRTLAQSAEESDEEGEEEEVAL